MDNGQFTIDNDCVAKGDLCKYICEANTIIIHYTLSIVNSFSYMILQNRGIFKGNLSVNILGRKSLQFIHYNSFIRAIIVKKQTIMILGGFYCGHFCFDR